MTYSERDLLSVFFKRITACLFDTSEKKNARGSEERAGCDRGSEALLGDKGKSKLVAGGRSDAPSSRLHPTVDLHDAVSDRI